MEEAKQILQAKKGVKNAKSKRFAATIGVEDNDKYKKCLASNRLIMNISGTKYYVIHFVAKHLFGYKLSRINIESPEVNEENVDWDIFWTDVGIQPERLYRMKPYQRINHFPGMYMLSRKNNLARNLMKMEKEFPKDYKFFPRTYLLPSEYGELKAQSLKKTRKPQFFICKPEASC